MIPRIVEKQSFRVAGMAIRTNEQENRLHGTIPAFWARVRNDAAFWEALGKIAVGPAALGLSTDFDGRGFSYWIAKEVEADVELPAGLQGIIIPHSATRSSPLQAPSPRASGRRSTSSTTTG